MQCTTGEYEHPRVYSDKIKRKQRLTFLAEIFREFLQLDQVFLVHGRLRSCQRTEHVILLRNSNKIVKMNHLNKKKIYIYLVTVTIVTGGSSSLSLGTSIQLISIAPGEPGLQGASRSSAITFGSFSDGPRTRRKCVAVCTLRTGCMSASRTKMVISAPENLHNSTFNISRLESGITIELCYDLPLGAFRQNA